MGKTLNELGYELYELYRATGKVTDSIDIRLFKDWIKQARATFLKQRFDEPMSIIDEANVQDLGAVTFIKVDSSLATQTSGKYMMRSSTRIPNTINRRGNIGTFTRIAPADMLEKRFNFVSYDRALVSGNGKFNNNDIYAFVNDGYMYLISKTNIHKYITSVNIKGVFINPQDAYNFRYPNAWTDDMEFPVSQSIVMDMINAILDKKFKLIMTPLEDKVSNGTDDVTNLVVRK